eukprot:3548348-Amphidinium_carterae.1
MLLRHRPTWRLPKGRNVGDPTGVVGSRQSWPSRVTSEVSTRGVSGRRVTFAPDACGCPVTTNRRVGSTNA